MYEDTIFEQIPILYKTFERIARSMTRKFPGLWEDALSIMVISALELPDDRRHKAYAKRRAICKVIDEIFRSRRYIHYSYKGVYARVPFPAAIREETPDDIIEQISDAILCREILDELSEDDRILIVSRYWGNLLIREIAEILNISSSMVSKRRPKILNEIRGIIVQQMTKCKIPSIHKIEWVAPSTLHPNRWNPNVQNEFMYQQMKNSLIKFGFADPIKVRTDGEGKREIIDGEHRLKAAKDLKMPFVPIVNYGPIPDHIAQQLTLALRIQGEDDKDKLAAVLKELETSIGRIQLMEIIPYQPGEVDALLASIDLSGAGAQAPSEEWVEITCRFPKEAEGAVFDEFKRIGDIMQISDDKSPAVKNGLILENICVLSGLTPTESLESTTHD